MMWPPDKKYLLHRLLSSTSGAPYILSKNFNFKLSAQYDATCQPKEDGLHFGKWQGIRRNCNVSRYGNYMAHLLVIACFIAQVEVAVDFVVGWHVCCSNLVYLTFLSCCLIT